MKNVFIFVLFISSTLLAACGGGDSTTVSDEPINMIIGTEYSIDTNDVITPTSALDPEIEIIYDPTTEVRRVILLKGSATITRNP